MLNMPEFEGDYDWANYLVIMRYRQCDLPLDRVEDWLKSCKIKFQTNPPLWLNSNLFTGNQLPLKIINNVWEKEEYQELIKKLKERE